MAAPSGSAAAEAQIRALLEQQANAIRAGAWKIAHQHASVPFDGASGRASLSLEP
jgi:hypothetical protein